MELTNSQKTTLSLLSKSPLSDKFYLSGGTLLACHYLKHRRSEDLDFFSQEQFSFEEVNQFIQQLKKRMGFKKVEYQKIFDRHQFLLENKESLKIEFVYYNHEKKMLGKRDDLFGIKVDSLIDLAANKTLALFDRNEPKDLFDIYFLITKSKFTPKQLLGLVSKKFGVKFSEALFWSEAFKKITLLYQIRPLMLEKNNKKQDELLREITEYFKNQSAQFLKESLT